MTIRNKSSEAFLQDLEELRLELVEEHQEIPAKMPPPIPIDIHEYDLNIDIDTIPHTSIRKLIALRENLKLLRAEIADKILEGVQGYRDSYVDAKELVGELNATVKQNQ